MSTNDPAVIDKNLAFVTQVMAKFHQMERDSGLVSSNLKGNKLYDAYSDALEFWREKKAQAELGSTVEIHAGSRFANYLKTQIGEYDTPVGNWNWWNGYAVGFNANGGAWYSAPNSPARGGVGRWQKTGTDSYHVHWLKSNTDDYFTLSSDGMKLEGKFDGKPGVSTRKC